MPPVPSRPLRPLLGLLGLSLSVLPLGSVTGAGIPYDPLKVAEYPLLEPTIQEWVDMVKKDAEGGKMNHFDTFKKEENLLEEWTKTPAEAVRLANTTFREFSYYVHRGFPVIVEDMSRGWPMKDWSCDKFVEKFPSAVMKSEYLKTGNPDDRIRLDEIDWIRNVRKVREEVHVGKGEAPIKAAGDEKTPQYGPYVCHIKDEQTRQLKTEVQGYMREPYFFTEEGVQRAVEEKMQKQCEASDKDGKVTACDASKAAADPVSAVPINLSAPSDSSGFDPLNSDLTRAHPINSAYINSTFEFWFSPGSRDTGGGGAMAHNDGYCQIVLSSQFSGEKRWSYQLMPEMSHGVFSTFDEGDEGPNKAGKWRPQMSGMVPNGGGTMFGPGLVHQTKT